MTNAQPNNGTNRETPPDWSDGEWADVRCGCGARAALCSGWGSTVTVCSDTAVNIENCPKAAREPCPMGRTDYDKCFAPFRYCPVKGCGRAEDGERLPNDVT